MSSKFSRLLLSTCLPLAAISVLGITSAKAGFEWVAPEPVQPAPEILPENPAPEVEQDTLPLPPVQDNNPELSPPPVPEDVQDYETKDPSIKTKVMKPQVEPVPEDEVSAPVFNEDSALKSKKFTGKTKPPSDPVMPSEENVPQKEDVKVPVVPEPVMEQPVIPDVPVKEEVQKTEPEIKSNTPKSGEPEILEINPFPLQEKDVPQSDETTPVVLPPAEEQKGANAKEEINWNEGESFAVVEGFGKDVPLALALGQIVPAKYAYSFGKGVNPGALVSWDGGRPWNEVLRTVLTPLNIDMQIRGKTLLLRASEGVQATEVVSAPADKTAKPEADSKKSVKSEGADQFSAPVYTPENNKAKLPEKTQDVIEETLKPVDSAPVPSSSLAPPPPVEEPKAVEKKKEKEPEQDKKESVKDVKPAKEEAKKEKPKDVSRKVILDPGQTTGQQPAGENAPLPLPVEEGKKKSEGLESSQVDQAEEPVSEEVALPEENLEESSAVQTQDSPPVDVVVQDPMAAELPQEDTTAAPLPGLDDAPLPESSQPQNADAIAQPVPLTEEMVASAPELESAPVPKEEPALDPQTVGENSVPGLEDEIKPVPAEPKPANPAVVLTEDIVGSSASEPVPEAVTPDAGAGDKPSASIVAGKVEEVRVWQASKGGDLRNVLEKWCRQTGVELVWKTEKDYGLAQDVIINGSFDTAINILFSQAVKDAPAHNLGKEGDVPKLTVE